MVVNITNLSVGGNIKANGLKTIVAQLGDLEVIDVREKSSDKMYVIIKPTS